MEKEETVIIKSTTPIVYYFWIIVSGIIFVGTLYIGINVLYAFLISFLISLIIFGVIAQYSCRFVLNDKEVEIRYLFPNRKNRTISLVDVTHVEFELSYFYYWEDDFKMKYFYWAHPYDTMEVFYQNDKISEIIKLNASYRSTRKMYKYLKEKYHVPFKHTP